MNASHQGGSRPNSAQWWCRPVTKKNKVLGPAREEKKTTTTTSRQLQCRDPNRGRRTVTNSSCSEAQQFPPSEDPVPQTTAKKRRRENEPKARDALCTLPASGRQVAPSVILTRPGVVWGRCEAPPSRCGTSRGSG